ncbi:MAG: hypothetical protein PUP92_27320 [Rhizonema sp. PD38]|nr:hypothetical protein [Rhizonema sp. PD38]
MNLFYFGGRRRPKQKAADFIDVIGERIRLKSLREIPTYQCFENELPIAFIEVVYLS